MLYESPYFRLTKRQPPKTGDAESKTFRNDKRNTVEYVGFWAWDRKRSWAAAAEQRSSHHSHQCASVRVDVRATPRRQPTGRRRGRGGKKLSRRCWRRRRHRTKLYFTHDDGDDPLSISFSLFRTSAVGACCVHVIIIWATQKILTPHSLHIA